MLRDGTPTIAADRLTIDQLEARLPRSGQPDEPAGAVSFDPAPDARWADVIAVMTLLHRHGLTKARFCFADLARYSRFDAGPVPAGATTIYLQTIIVSDPEKELKPPLMTADCDPRRPLPLRLAR